MFVIRKGNVSIICYNNCMTMLFPGMTLMEGKSFKEGMDEVREKFVTVYLVGTAVNCLKFKTLISFSSQLKQLLSGLEFTKCLSE